MGQFIYLEGEADTSEEAIKLCAAELLTKGLVKEDFYSSCVERERQYPTGLTDQIPVALPHTTKDKVIEEAVCVLRLKKPVKFYSMQNTDQQIDVRIVINMALLDDSEHLSIITNVINSLKNPGYVKQILTLPSNETERLLKKTIYGE